MAADATDLDLDDATWRNAKRRIRAAAESGGYKVRLSDRFAAIARAAFAEPGAADPVWIGLYLDAAAADALSDAADAGSLGGFPLHVTLWYGAGPTDERQWARVVSCLDEIASWSEPLAGQIAGVGVFQGADPEPVYATPSVPGLDELRATIAERLGWHGLPDDAARGWVPHVTLLYRPAGSDDALPDVPLSPLSFDALTVMWGEREIRLPFGLMADEDCYFEYSDPVRRSTRVSQPLRLAEGARPDAEWVPCLPVPGTYSHPWYGDLEFTPESHARAVANLKAKVYQDSLPVNAEHDLATSGAVGWIEDARVNSAGALDVFVRWTQRGKDLLADDRFRYVSAEYMWRWTDPVDGAEYTDIIYGLAVCTLPYFKPSVLRPLPAAGEALAATDNHSVSYGGVTVTEAGTTWTVSQWPPTTTVRVLSPPAAPAGGSTMPEVKGTEQAAPTEAQFADLTARMAQLTERLNAAEGRATEAEGKAAEFATKLDTATTELETQKRDARRARFTAEVSGKSAANGHRWVGATVQAHVEHLEKLADAFGEDSAEVKFHTDQQRAIAASDSTSALFREIGTDAPGSDDLQGRFTAEVARVQKDEGITRQKAYAKVCKLPEFSAAVVKGEVS